MIQFSEAEEAAKFALLILICSAVTGSKVGHVRFQDFRHFYYMKYLKSN